MKDKKVTKGLIEEIGKSRLSKEEKQLLDLYSKLEVVLYDTGINYKYNMVYIYMMTCTFFKW